MEKENIINSAKAYLQGESIKNIAKKMGKSDSVMHRQLYYHLKDVDLELYFKVVTKLDDNNIMPESLEDEAVRKRILRTYQLLMEEGKDLDEIAAVLDSSVRIVYLDLSKRLGNLSKIAPTIVTEEMVSSAQKRLNQVINAETHVNFDINHLYKDEASQIKFMSLAALHFRLNLDTLSELMQMDKEALYTLLLQYFPKNAKAYKYLFSFDLADQQVAKREFMKYYEQILICLKRRKSESLRELLNKISDSGAVSALKNRIVERRRNTYYTKDFYYSAAEQRAIFSYQLKYAMSNDEVKNVFQLNSDSRAIKTYLEERPDLKERYDHMIATIQSTEFVSLGK